MTNLLIRELILIKLNHRAHRENINRKKLTAISYKLLLFLLSVPSLFIFLIRSFNRLHYHANPKQSGNHKTSQLELKKIKYFLIS
jgi:hypothetical protein